MNIPYGQVRDFQGSCALVRPQLEKALKDEGFGILTEIDVRATLKAKLGVDVRSQWILGACNPPIASKALESEPDIGLLLPCNVVLREVAGGGCRVATINPQTMMNDTENPDLVDLAAEIGARLNRVLEAIVD
ncbi:DUF302 domain-containing protein [bacterium]|nr:DUF302 domain-containing protein [bacterium]